MDVLKPPTDNLYKFLALSGVLIIIISLAYPTWLITERDKQLLIINRDIKLLEIDVERGGQEELDAGAAKERFKNIDKNIAEIEYKRKLANYYHDSAGLVLRLGLISMSTGLALAIYGFTFWYRKVQKYQDLILRNTANGKDAKPSLDEHE